MNTLFQHDTISAGYDSSIEKFYLWTLTEGKEEIRHYNTLDELVSELDGMNYSDLAETVRHA